MDKDLKCFFGIHAFKIIKEEKLYGDHNVTIGTLLTSQCRNCGKLTTKKIFKYNAYH